MNRLRLGLFAGMSTLSTLTFAAPYQASSGQVTFAYRVIIVPVQGKTAQVSAALDIDPDDLASAGGTVRVNVASLKTGNTLRDDHMAGALGAAQFRDAVFTLTNVQGLGRLPEGQAVSSTVNGQLSLKGVTQPLSAPVKLTRQGNSIAVATQFKFNPHDFGVNYLGGASSIAVNISFKLQTP
ncbi:hypothetical protein GCM10022631_41490 [Deinococcus rubellus]|uniref:YceI family protein n=1 Tax=Deinococcus rubellus TaxID=1889240 RepID=A0ABY5YJE0_9DEIO|nr:YceI family protein [Deinococcus rubellus]UWX65066.1 YceI family protein [Deinococcus rubellus]